MPLPSIESKLPIAKIFRSEEKRIIINGKINEMEKRLRVNLKDGCSSKIRVNAADEAKKRRAASRAMTYGKGRNISGSPEVPSPTLPVAVPRPALARSQKLEEWKAENAKKKQALKSIAKPIFKLSTVISYPSAVAEVPPRYVGVTTRARSGASVANPLPEVKSKRKIIKPKSLLTDVAENRKFVAPKSVKPLPLTVPQSPALAAARRKFPASKPHTLANMPSQFLKRKMIEDTGRSKLSALASAPSPSRSVRFTIPQMCPGTFKPVADEPLCFASPNVTVARGSYVERKRLSLAMALNASESSENTGVAEKTDTGAVIDFAQKNVNDTSIVVNVVDSSSAISDEGMKEDEKNALFFRNQLDAEIERLNCHCEKWSATRTSSAAKMSEEVQGILDSTIGLTQLLIRSKFEQFRRLTVQCEEGTSIPPILVLDLEGFWEMLKLQVENIDEKFKDLDKLERNGWQIQQAAKIIQKKITLPKKPNSLQTKPVKPSGIKAIMLAAKKKLMAEKALDDKLNNSVRLSSSNVLDPRLLELKGTPERSSKRMSLLQGVLSSNLARKAERNSPIMMRVSIGAKLIASPAVVNATAAVATAAATSSTDASSSPFIKPSLQNVGAAKAKRLSVSEGKLPKPRANKRRTILQQMQYECTLLSSKKTDSGDGSQKENKTTAPLTPGGSSGFSPRRSLRFTPYKGRRSESADGRPSLLPVNNGFSPMPLPSGELISFDTPPAIRRSTRHRH